MPTAGATNYHQLFWANGVAGGYVQMILGNFFKCYMLQQVHSHILGLLAQAVAFAAIACEAAVLPACGCGDSTVCAFGYLRPAQAAAGLDA